MKKQTLSIILCFMILGLIGCSSQGVHSGMSMSIEKTPWRMLTIQDSEKDGVIIAFGSNQKTSSSTQMIELYCTANQGTLLLTDKSNAETYEGSYTPSHSEKTSIIYSLKFNDIEGLAVVSSTSYYGGKSHPTLIITADNYTLTFIPESEF